jgi:hypothetical protein
MRLRHLPGAQPGHRAASQRADAGAAQIRRRPDIARAVKVISSDEDNHLAYCYEELLRLAAAGHAPFIRRTLRTAALAEMAIYCDVSTAVMAHPGPDPGLARPKAAVLAAGIRPVYAWERLGGWRRMASLRMPARRNALGGPAPRGLYV